VPLHRQNDRAFGPRKFGLDTAVTRDRRALDLDPALATALAEVARAR
jgi:hypothetical protein